MKEIKASKGLLKMVKAFLISFCLFFGLLALICILLSFSDLSEQGMLWLVRSALFISCLFMGASGGIIAKKKGFLFGALFAAVLILSVLVVSFYLTGSASSVKLFQPTYFLCLLLGSVGGVMGVNVKN